MSEQGQALVRRFFDEVCNGRNLGLADQLFAPDHVYHDPSDPWVGKGPAGMKDLIGFYQRNVGDARWVVHATHDAGDVMVTRWSGQGVHNAELMGVVATNKRVSVDGIWMHRVAGGKIAESWNVWDTLGLLQQIGAVPATAAPKK